MQRADHSRRHLLIIALALFALALLATAYFIRIYR
jgi:hypothetical protein